MNRPLGMQVVPGIRIPRRREEPGASGAAFSPTTGVYAFKAWWLGQAGFLFQAGGLRILVDPYLSDSLAKKYEGTRYPHTRLCPPPVLPGELRDIDAVLVSHGHTDHLDPGTLPAVLMNNPGCRVVMPESCRAAAVERGIAGDRIEAVNAGDRIELCAGAAWLSVLPSAHEDLGQDTAGRFLYLGYLLEVGGLVVYHPGDCVPYPALRGILAGFGPDIAFLPVNGRDARRSANGILGNFSLSEAVDLVLSMPGCLGVGHHFGLFDFNTIDPGEGKRYLAARSGAVERFILAESDAMLGFTSGVEA